MLTVACVNVGNYLGRGQEYVDRLRDGVAKHLTMPHRFRVFGDADVPEGVTGWWAKLALFGAFEPGTRVLFMDLDTIVTGSLDDMARYDGPLAMLRDFHRPWALGSGVMLWEAGRYCHIWEKWLAAGKPIMRGGDQMWIEMMERRAARLQDLFPGQIASLKVDCVGSLPEGARLCCYHGQPKPHENHWLPYLEKTP